MSQRAMKLTSIQTDEWVQAAVLVMALRAALCGVIVPKSVLSPEHSCNK